MKDLGKGIATAGIWVGVGLIAFAGGEAAMVALPIVAMFGAGATVAVWFFGT